MKKGESIEREYAKQELHEALLHEGLDMHGESDEDVSALGRELSRRQK
jgi:hypothetical protein